MCIGIPMQVFRIEPGHAWVAGRGEVKRVDTALVGDCAEQDWLLVFLDAARERIDAARAAEVNAVLDLLQGALAGSPSTGAGRKPQIQAIYPHPRPGSLRGGPQITSPGIF